MFKIYDYTQFTISNYKLRLQISNFKQIVYITEIVINKKINSVKNCVVGIIIK